MPSNPSTSKANPMSYSGTVKRALSSADISSVPVSVNAETGRFTVVMITGTPVRRMIDDPRNPGQKVLVDEVIVPEGVDLSRAQGMPLIDGHRTDAGIAAILGKIDNVMLENGQIIGEAMFASDHEYRLKDVQRGFYRQGSICADILEVEWVERVDGPPLVLITRSLATDYSLVAVGADPNPIIRSADKFYEAFQNVQPPLPDYRITEYIWSLTIVARQRRNCIDTLRREDQPLFLGCESQFHQIVAKGSLSQLLGASPFS
jgi:hypothetical protein